MRILLLEDEPELQDAVSDALREDGMSVDVAATLRHAREALTLVDYDGLVLDRRVPDGDGLELVGELRAAGSTVPALMLTALGEIHQKVAGFETGADDYLAKPFAIDELVMRVRVLVRRGTTARAAVVTLGDVEFDRGRRRVRRSGVVLPLTAKELAILDVLADPPGRIVDRLELLERCWDHAADPSSNVIDVHVRGLRRKLGEGRVETVRGAGYRLSGA